MFGVKVWFVGDMSCSGSWIVARSRRRFAQLWVCTGKDYRDASLFIDYEGNFSNLKRYGFTKIHASHKYSHLGVCEVLKALVGTSSIGSQKEGCYTDVFLRNWHSLPESKFTTHSDFTCNKHKHIHINTYFNDLFLFYDFKFFKQSQFFWKWVPT